MAYSYGEIRAFTGEEIAWMQAAMNAVDAAVAARWKTLAGQTINPLNYILETQRDAMTRAQNLVTQDQNNAQQLHDTMNSTIESGDTDKLASWFALANTITGGDAAKIFQSQIDFASTAQTVKTVAQDTANQIASPSSWPWWVWAIGAGLALAILKPYVTAFNSRRGKR